MRPRLYGMFALTAFKAGGCTPVGGSSNWRPPRDAVLFAETPQGGNERGYADFQDADDATFYLYDPSSERLLYTGLIKRGDVVRLYTDRAMVMPSAIATQPADAVNSSRYAVAQYPGGTHVRAYVLRTYAAGMPRPPTPLTP